ncbi:C40 family peptidase [Kordiimonas aestuarii]|uniref:C40 family peptidase n=1 Tax=Kordiimonas aestuarii TaxID=1005925 RepID=UPI0021D0725C|nr:C40 family peptidase [Kordiimonas aestuarii]
MNDLLHPFGLPPLHDPEQILDSNPHLLHASRIDGVIARPITPIKSEPESASQTLSEALYGEPVQLIAEAPGWWFIISIIDGYMGWVSESAVADYEILPTHRVHAPLTHVYSEPSLKSEPELILPMGAFVTLPGPIENGFVETALEGWIYAKHLQAIGTANPQCDPVSTAEQFIGSPYLWGGRSKLGIDCSGLVQLALSHIGFRTLRDTGPQFRSIGNLLEAGEKPVRGDLAFFPGHVGWMIDGVHLLHANATHMAVTIDPVNEVIRWVQKDLERKGQDLVPFKGFRRIS